MKWDESTRAAWDAALRRQQVAQDEQVPTSARADSTHAQCEPPAREPHQPDLLDALLHPGALPEREANALRAWSSTFFPFQRRWLYEPSRYAACNKSRQIGQSHTSGAAAVVWGAFLGETTTVTSIGERESKELIGYAAKHIGVLEELGSQWVQCKPGSLEIAFPGGGRILALPASSGGRGYSGNAILDEFAYHVNAEAVWDGAAASTTLGYRLRVLSTPNGVGNTFHKLITDEKTNRGWSIHTYDVHRAIREGYPIDLDDCWKKAKHDPRLFGQLYECSFLDGDFQYIPTGLVDASVHYGAPWVEGASYAGLDIGLENDLSSLTTIKVDKNGVAHEQETRTCKRTDWEAQQAMILESFENWGWRLLCVDSTGLGAVPAQLLEKAMGRHRVLQVPFTQQSKEILATGMYERFATRTVRIRPDEKMRHDICSLRRIVTSAGHIRYDAPRTQDGHADRAWSLALALHACSPLVAAGARIERGYGDFENP